MSTFTYGKWYTSAGATSLLDTDTTTNGVQVDITLTSSNSYHAVMTPLGNPGLAYSTDGTLENKGLTDQGAVNWVTYQLYNTDSNFYPGLPACGPDPTDFYIKSMTVSGLRLNIQKAGANVTFVVDDQYARFQFGIHTEPQHARFGTPFHRRPSVVNNQNVVTNPIAGAQQFYRLRMPQ